MIDARVRLDRRITARLDAQTPGVRTTRFCRTQIAPVVCATILLTVARPAKPFAPMKPASTAARPAFVTIAIRPSSLGRVVTMDTPFPNFGKVEYFRQRGLTDGLVFCPPVNPRACDWAQSPNRPPSEEGCRQDLMNESRSGLRTSACVVSMPWG